MATKKVSSRQSVGNSSPRPISPKSRPLKDESISSSVSSPSSSSIPPPCSESSLSITVSWTRQSLRRVASLARLLKSPNAQTHHLPKGLTRLTLFTTLAVTFLSIYLAFNGIRDGGLSTWFCDGWVNHYILNNSSLCHNSEDVQTKGLRGGWRLPNEAVWSKFGTEKCTIERVSVRDITPERFESEYRYKKSVMVTFPNGAADWTTPGDWSKQDLKKRYSNRTIRSGQSLEIVRKGGNARHVSSFEEYVDGLLYEEEDGNFSSDPSHYACDREFFWYSRLASRMRLPQYFEINTTADESIFFLGPSRSGVVFHKHSDTWNGVIYGYKRWFLYPNTRTPAGGVYAGHSLLNWVTHIYPLLKEEEKPLECVQYPGDILYVAEGTYHATLNLGDTVAVAIQKRKAATKAEHLSYEATDLTNFLTHKKKEETLDPKNVFHKRLLAIYKEWFQLLPGSSEAALKAGEVLIAMHEYEEALVWLEKALKLDPYFVYAYINMGVTLTELRQYERAEEYFVKAIGLSPDLWDNYKAYGEFLLKAGRHHDALPIFKKGTELMPDMIPFWFYYKQCQVYGGDLEGAQASEETIQAIRAREAL